MKVTAMTMTLDSENAERRSPWDPNSFFDNAPIGLAEFDVDLRIVRANQFLSDIDDVLVDQYHGKTLSECLPTVGDRLEPLLRLVLRDGGSIESEIASDAAGNQGGSSVWKVKLFPLRGVDKAINGVGAVVEDISEQKASETALRDSKQRLRTFIERAPVAIAMFDTEMRYVAVSRRFLTDRGLSSESPGSMCGRNHYECFPETLGRWRVIHARVLSGETHSAEEDSYQKADGKTEWVRWEMTPWWRPDGAVGGALLYTEIITPRKEIEESLRASEMLLRMSQDIGRIGGWDWDLATNTIRWSDTQALQFGMHPNGGQPISKELWRRSVHPEDLARIESQIPLLLEKRNSSDVEYRIQGPNGLRWLYSRFQVIRDAEGVATRVVGIDMDITERITMENELRILTKNLEKRVEDEVAAREIVQARLAHAEKLKSIGELTGGIAHDFNNMLTVIIGAIDVMADAVAADPELSDLARLIENASGRAAKLTASLLAFARRQPLSPREVDVEALLGAVCELVAPTISDRISVNRIARADVQPAWVDPDQLIATLVNLSLNARDAMPNGGTLTFETGNAVLDKNEAENRDCEKGCYTTIVVSDDGVGVPRAIQSRVFEPFFSTKGIGRGTGLGLSTVFGFLKQSGGHIEMFSEEGIGTKFTIFLPIASTRSEYAHQKGLLPANNHSKKVVLSVEDDALVRAHVSKCLKKFGYSVVTASNAREALIILGSDERVDLLFTDIAMPGGIDGVGLAEEATALRPELKVLFTTGYSESVVQRTAVFGEAAILAKPYKPAQLKQMIHQAIATNAAPKE